jgi:serine/threonine-protein kinase RsbW
VSESEDISVPSGGFWPLDRSVYTLRWRTALPSSRDSINTAVHMILDLARQCGCEESEEADLEIALREAVANAVIHGNASDVEKQIFVRAYGSTENALLVLVRDEGSGFEPEGVPDPRGTDRLELAHGRGLFLMRALMDRVEYRRNGCEVLLFKRW